MSEGPPKLPTQESVERQPKFETVSLEVLEEWRDADGDVVKKEKHVETNGTRLRVTVEEVTYDSDGEIIFVGNSETEEFYDALSNPEAE